MLIADISDKGVYLFDTGLDNTSRRGWTDIEDLRIYEPEGFGKFEVDFKSKNKDVSLYVDGIQDGRTMYEVAE